MNYLKKIFLIALIALTKGGISFAQTVDATPETQTICSGASANLSAVIIPGPGSGATTSYTISSIGYAPNSYTAGTVVPSSDDTQSGPFPIGFSFSFFGTCNTQFYIGSNGWVAFSPQPTTFASSTIPNTGATIPKNCIMGPWQDWLPAAANIHYQTLGVAPNRRLVVSWSNCPMFSCTANLGTFQIVIYESTNVIENYIQNKPNCVAWSGGTGVQGLHNATGTIAFTVPGRNSTQWTATNEGWRYTPNAAAALTINWYVLPSNTLVGTGSPITVTPPAGQASTSYYASITGSSLCAGAVTSTDTIVVLQTIFPAMSASNNGPLCAGSTLLLSCLPVSTPGATYSWTGPSGFTSTLQNPTIFGVNPGQSGIYSVTMTIGACTSAPVTTNVTIFPVPSTPLCAGPANVCVGDPINLATTSPGPWNWTGPGGFTSSLQNPVIPAAALINSGTYFLTVIGPGGCTSPSGAVIVNVNPIPAAPTVSNQTVCYNNSAMLTASVSGATYEWYDAPVPAGTLLTTGPTYTTPALTTTTSYYVQTTTAAGCTGPMTTVTVTVAPSLVVNAGLDDSICSGGFYTLSALPSGAGYSYLWDAPGTPGFSTSASPTVTPAATTTYTVTVYDAFGCSGTDMVTITVGTPLILNATGTPATCFGTCNGTGNVIASGSFGGYTYNWTPGGSISNSISSLCTGVYNINVTDSYGCTATDTIQVLQPTLLSLAISATTSHCSLADGSATVVASGGSGGYTYLWTNGQTTATATGLASGSYCVTVTDIHGCFDSLCVTVPNAPGVVTTISNTPVSCNGLCDGTASVTASSGLAPYTYSWSSGQTTPSITGLCPGTYTCTITDASGCSVTASTVVAQPPVILINPISGVTICVGQSTTLNATATGGHPLGGYTYDWTAPAFTGPAYTVSPTTTTTYTVVATDSAGCVSQSPQTVTVTVNPPLSVVASPNVSICPGASTTLSGIASGGNGSYTYNWTPGAGIGSSFSVSPAVTTTYTITVNDACTAIPATATVTVTVLPVPVVSFSSDVTSGCEPTCVTFTDASTVAGGTVTAWNWNFGDGAVSSLQNPLQHCYNAGTYDISLTVTSNGGCVSSNTINNMITIYPQPVAQFVLGPQPTTTENPTIDFTDVSANALSWSWNFDDPANLYQANTSTQANPSHTYADSGLYCVTLIVQSMGGCADTTVRCLVIDPEFTFYIPNAFSPNDDGLNNIFAPKGQNIVEFSMRIFDRWGNMIFHSTSMNEGWDGRVQGKSEIAQEDVYVYNIEIKDNVGKKHRYIGTVTIVK